MAGTNSSLDVYAFDTLWQEITQGVGYIFSSIFGGITDIVGTRAYYNAEETKYEEHRKITNFSTLADSGKNGNVLLTIGIIALIAIVAYIIYTNYKNN